MSDRLDIVRLIDSKVSSTRRTVARSKQLAEAAKDDLSTHAEWLARHSRAAQEELERHRRRLDRKRRAEARKHFALWLLLLVPSACAATFRAGFAGLGALGEAFYFGCCWIGRTAFGATRFLVRLVAGGITWASTTLLTLGLWVAAGLWLVLSALGASSRDVAVCAFAAGARGVTWLEPRSRSLSHRLAKALSFGFSRLAILIVSLSARLARAAQQQIKTPAARRRDDVASFAERREPTLDPRRLHAAAFIRLRAEHDRLQARIHALGGSYGSRVPPRDRKLGRDARQLFEIQEAEMLDRPAPRENGRSPARKTVGAGPAAAALAHSVQTRRPTEEPPAIAAVLRERRAARRKRRHQRLSPSAS